MNPALQAVITIAVGVGGCVGYFWASNLFLDKVLFPIRNFNAGAARRINLAAKLVILVIVGLPMLRFMWLWMNGGRSFGDGTLVTVVLLAVVAALLWASIEYVSPAGGLSTGDRINRANLIRPWLFLLPALIALGLYLAYPVFATLWLSFHDESGDAFVGLANYQTMLGEPKFWESLRNNMLWLIVVPALATAFGLLAAQLTDRIKWGNIAKAMIFMPMAISFVGASVIWKLVYDVRPEGTDQIGILNAITVALGGAPQQWLQLPFWNNFFLMAVLIWIQAGFAMVILSAALRGIPEETIEAAIIDGASPLQIFFKIKVPQIMGTIVVVWTTITITVLKVFDIVLAMTNGEWNTQVLANYMFAKLFRSGTGDWGVGSAAAMVIMLLVLPILVWNVRNARREMQ